MNSSLIDSCDEQPRARLADLAGVEIDAEERPPTAWSTFASAKTTFGDLPPSSSEIFFRLPEAACMIVLPTAVEPVNATLSTFGDAASSAPTTAPAPVTTLITPAGGPPR